MLITLYDFRRNIVMILEEIYEYLWSSYHYGIIIILESWKLHV